MTKPKLGFDAIANIKVDQPTDEETTIDRQRLDRLSHHHGFDRAMPGKKITKRTITEESTANLSLRPPLSSYNRFVAFSIEYRLSYPEALKALLDKAGVDENGVIARNNPS